MTITPFKVLHYYNYTVYRQPCLFSTDSVVHHTVESSKNAVAT